MGAGFPRTFPEREQYTRKELFDMGINDSVIHQDFMVGTADLNIDGITQEGELVPIFRNGTWAF